MTCGSITRQQGGDGYVVVTGNRADSGYLRGAPGHLCIYNEPPALQAEYLTPTAEAAKKIYTDALADVALNGDVKLKQEMHNPRLVRVNVPPSPSYIDFWTALREPLPEGPKRDIGNRYAEKGHPGIAGPLRVFPPQGAENLEICVFLTPNGPTELKVLQQQKITT